MTTKVKSKISSGIGYSPLTETVYMGRQNQEKGMWVGEKKDVTNQFVDCAFSYFDVNTVRTISIGKEKHLFAHIKKDNASIERMIKHLTKLIK